MLLLTLWIGFGGTTASAAIELNRLIAAQEQSLDREYRIDVEDVAVPDRDRHTPRPVDLRSRRLMTRSCTYDTEVSSF